MEGVSLCWVLGVVDVLGPARRGGSLQIYEHH